MRIGEGILGLGMLGINREDEQEISVTELGKLARHALAFHPLSKIFTVTDMRVRNFPEENLPFRYLKWFDEEIDLIKKDKNPDVIAVIERVGRCEYEPQTGLVYSEVKPKILAHELGHSLGLMHPLERCGYLDCGIDAKFCSYSQELMGCGEHPSGVKGFSKDDLTKLNGLLTEE